MSRESVKTLFHPFATDTLTPPAKGERVLFLGAEAGFALPEGFEAEITAVQGLKPLFRQLQATHLEPVPEIEGEDYDCALIIAGRHRGENENWIAEALKRVKIGGLIVIAGGKEDGIQSLRKRLEGFGWTVDHMPKYHGVAVWFARPEDVSEILPKLERQALRIEGKYSAAPGMFSHDKVDGGSELLAGRLPEDFDGNVADFGAAWGYLSIALAKKSPKVNRIDLYEADYASLEHAKLNMAENVPNIPARFFWFDLIGEEVKDRYDLVIMNPPFHEGHAAEPSLGQAMIRTAQTALKNGGRLMLVANRGLPYEAVLSELFKDSGEICRNSRFKVLFARK